MQTREEDQELDRVWSEFQQFADARLERVSETYSINQVKNRACALSRHFPAVFSFPHLRCASTLFASVPFPPFALSFSSSSSPFFGVHNLPQSCSGHTQIEVIRAFRRFHARHRSMDFEGSATDVLIAENFRRWYLSGYPYFDANLGIVISRPPTPTAAGFFKGVKLKEVPF